MASCTNFEEISFEQVEKQNSIVYQKKRSYEEALLIAQQSAGLFESSETRTAAAGRKINLNDTKFI